MTTQLPTPDRSRAGWWALTLALGATFAFVLHAFVGTFVFGVFLYYGVRPLQRRFSSHLGDELSALLAVVVVVLPALVFVGAILLVGISELLAFWESGALQDALAGIVDLEGFEETLAGDLEGTLGGMDQLAAGTAVGPVQTVLGATTAVLAFLSDVLLHVFIALTVAFYLLRDDDRVREWFEANVAGRGSSGHAYVTAVDRDLATIYFGNVALIGVVAVIAGVIYHGYNLVAPSALSVPFPTMAAMLTGFASMVPLIVGKVVYVPLVLYLGALAARSNPALLVFPVGLFAACLVFADLLPMGLLLPRIAGRKTHVGLVLFSYILGPVLFGWYGLFLAPLLLVLGIQLVRIGFTELLHGDPVTPHATSAEGIGSDPDIDDPG